MKEEFSYSVIIPVYNDLTRLINALESVRKQNLQPKQVVVVDDASNIEIRDAIASFGALYIRLENNSGSSQARKTGIQFSDSDYIFFLDSDDFWYPDHAELHAKLWREFSETRIGAIGTLLEPQIGERQTDAYFRKNSRMKMKGNRHIGVVELLGNNPFFNSGLSFRRSNLNSIFRDERLNERFCEDMKLLSFIAMHNFILLLVPQETGSYNLEGMRKSEFRSQIFRSFQNISKDILEFANEIKSTWYLILRIRMGIFQFNLRWLFFSLIQTNSFQSYLMEINNAIDGDSESFFIKAIRNPFFYISVKAFVQQLYKLKIALHG